MYFKLSFIVFYTPSKEIVCLIISVKSVLFVTPSLRPNKIQWEHVWNVHSELLFNGQLYGYCFHVFYFTLIRIFPHIERISNFETNTNVKLTNLLKFCWFHFLFTNCPIHIERWYYYSYYTINYYKLCKCILQLLNNT